MHKQNNNIWEKAFNDHSLDNESWLEPASDVFDNISSEIYKEKRSQKYWLIIFLLLVVLGIATIILLSSKTNPADFNTNVKSSKNELLETQEQITEIDAVRKTISSTNIQEENNSKSTKSQKSLINSAQKEKNNSLINRIIENNITEVNNKSLKPQQSKIQENIYNIDKNNITVLNEGYDNLNSNNVTNLNNNLLLPITQIKAIHNEIHFSYEKPKLNFNNNSFSKIIKEPYSNKNTLSLMIGAEVWAFNLNENYQSALNPADFSHSNGKGLSAQINYGYQLNTQIGLAVKAGYQNINLNSGHNSALTYDNNNELISNSNQFDLLMASPLGFMNSNISIERRENTTGDKTDIIVDLDNKHNITNIDLALGLDFTLWNNKNYFSNLSVFGGANYLIGIKNNLSAFQVDNDTFNSGEAGEVTLQESYNNIVPFVGIGFNIGKNLNNDYSIGLRTEFNTSIQPLYQELDFSTQVNRYNIGFFVSKSF